MREKVDPAVLSAVESQVRPRAPHSHGVTSNLTLFHDGTPSSVPADERSGHTGLACRPRRHLRHGRHQRHGEGRHGRAPRRQVHRAQQRRRQRRAHRLFGLPTGTLLFSCCCCCYNVDTGTSDDYLSLPPQEFQAGDSARSLPVCRHTFHLPCIDGWLLRHASCPLCRRAV